MFNTVFVLAAALFAFLCDGVAVADLIVTSSVTADGSSFAITGGVVELPPNPDVLGDYEWGVVASAQNNLFPMNPGVGLPHAASQFGFFDVAPFSNQLTNAYGHAGIVNNIMEVDGTAQADGTNILWRLAAASSTGTSIFSSPAISAAL